MITYEQIKTICNPHGAPAFQNPWTTPDGKTCATDQKILVVVEAVFPETPEFPIGAKPLDPDRYLSALDRKTLLLETSRVKIKKFKVECRDCKGTGVFSVCPDCDGFGECTCSCGDEHDCHMCRGTGWIVGDDGSGDAEACEDCGGAGKIEKADPVEIHGYCLSGLLLEKIMALPGFRNLRAEPGRLDLPLAFDFDGGCGVVMPILNVERRR